MGNIQDEILSATPEMIEEAQALLQSYYLPFTVREEVLTEVFRTHPDLLTEGFNYGLGDTAVREQLLEAVTMILVGEEWPTYGANWTDDAIEKFSDELDDANRNWSKRS